MLSNNHGPAQEDFNISFIRCMIIRCYWRIWHDYHVNCMTITTIAILHDYRDYRMTIPHKIITIRDQDQDQGLGLGSGIGIGIIRWLNSYFIQFLWPSEGAANWPAGGRQNPTFRQWNWQLFASQKLQNFFWSLKMIYDTAKGTAFQRSAINN